MSEVKRDPRHQAGDVRYQIAVLEKAMDLLELIAESPALTLTQLAGLSAITKVRAFRLLANLERRRYVRRDEVTGGYRLGLQILHLSGALARDLDLRSVARPILESLRIRFGETVNLAVPTGGHIAYVDILESPKGLRMTAQIGATDGLHSTALGKAILAAEPEEVVREVAKLYGLPAKTDRTITRVTELLRHLAEIRDRGYAIDDEENEHGARCVAAPIQADGHSVLGAVSISGPATRVSYGRIEEMGVAVREASQTISERLGHRIAAPATDSHLTGRPKSDDRSDSTSISAGA